MKIKLILLALFLPWMAMAGITTGPIADSGGSNTNALTPTQLATLNSVPGIGTFATNAANAAITTNQLYLPLAGMGLYLNAMISFQGPQYTNGAPVASWPDLSGQANAATIISGLTLNQGVCNGAPGVNMQGGYLVFSNLLSKYNLDTNFNITVVWGGFSKVPGSGLNSWIWAANDALHNTGLLGDQASSANNYGGMNIVGQTNSFLLSCYRQFDNLPNVSTVNYNGQVLTVWLNGMLQYNSAASREGGPTAGVGLGMAGSFWLGNDDEGNTPWLNGWISTVVLITNSLTVPQIMANNSYWCHFAGRTQDQLALAGESQMAGFGAANGGSPLAMLTGSFPGWDIENNAEPSQNSAGTLTNATVWQLAKHTENKFKITVASPNLVNDLFTSGGTTNTTIAGFTNFCALSHSNGWSVGFLTIPSELYIDTNNQTPRAVVNTWLYANWSQWADFIVDIASIPSIGTNGACSNLTYYASDMTHLNSAGWAIASNVLVNAISSYIQSKQSQGGITGNGAGLTNIPLSGLNLTPSQLGAVTLAITNLFAPPGFAWSISPGGGNATLINSGAVTNAFYTNTATVTVSGTTIAIGTNNFGGGGGGSFNGTLTTNLQILNGANSAISATTNGSIIIQTAGSQRYGLVCTNTGVGATNAIDFDGGYSGIGLSGASNRGMQFYGYNQMVFRAGQQNAVAWAGIFPGSMANGIPNYDFQGSVVNLSASPTMSVAAGSGTATNIFQVSDNSRANILMAVTQNGVIAGNGGLITNQWRSVTTNFANLAISTTVAVNFIRPFSPTVGSAYTINYEFDSVLTSATAIYFTAKTTNGFTANLVGMSLGSITNKFTAFPDQP